ncbi:SGNH/GDSL hydrolase family protein [Roseovarius pacificus]|uniref:SGNH/GDSL hydrolase family protein n=1 Tax=Roseovarius pacificus TaxID=337701 RepID=UPI002A18C04B|nr:SGNH/GDSL hydrolase family protein [Roseovarius pacificus]
MIRRLAPLAALLFLMGCTEPVTRDSHARILLLGDSMMAMHSAKGMGVSHAIEQELRQPVTDRSVVGARYLYALPISGSMGLNITKQYRPGKWDWIVLNGGGNDIWMGCGCGPCNGRISRLISRDGRRGRIPGFVSKLRQTGAQVVFVGYLRTPGVTSPIEGCADDGDEMDRRLARLAALDRGVHFVSLADLVPYGDRSYHGLDRIHPSAKGSRAIGERISDLIRERSRRRQPVN